MAENATNWVEPTAKDAKRILSAVTNRTVAEIHRFPNGLAHFVFDARLSDGERLVLRLTRPAQRNDFEGALYWSERLRPLGVPLAAIIHAELDYHVHGFPVLVLERLPGVDLGDCYAGLSPEEKNTIARQIVGIQRRAATVPADNGYGYASTPMDPSLKHSWRDVLDASLERTRQWTRNAGVMGEESIDRVAGEVDRFDDYFKRVQPICFLHDTTTKNVIVHRGRLAGIVDVDSVCYGDPLWAMSLTDMAMRSLGADRIYVDAWSDEIQLTAEEFRVEALYTAMHCVAFLGEIGQRFNKETAEPVDWQRVAQLRQALDDLLARL